MEWLCLLAIQIDSNKAQIHWKSVESMPTETPPAIIIKVFNNGFRNRYGFVIVGSSFALPWWLCASFNGYNYCIITILVATCWLARITCPVLIWYFVAKD